MPDNAMNAEFELPGSGPRLASWKAEWPLLLLLGIVAVLYFSRIESPPLRGEETRRAMVAINMADSGDWVVPRMQGTPYFMSSRPPVHNWMIAAAMALRGSQDLISIRLPCLIAVVLLSIILYAYARQTMSRVGAFAAGLSYISMVQVLELGRTGETDLPFTLFLSSALLFWHTGWRRQWSPWILWPVAYLLLTGAIMTKGPQAPVYFAMTIGLYLLWNGRWKFAVSWAHAAGIALSAGLISLWLVPFVMQLGLPGLKHVFTGDVVLYGGDRSLGTYIKHLLEFPPSMVLGCWAPWSLLLVNLCSKRWRERLRPHQQVMLFALIALATSFPTVWLVTGTRTRFLMSVYPLAAVLMGVTIEALFQAIRQSLEKPADGETPVESSTLVNPQPILPLKNFLGTFAIAAWVVAGAVLTVSVVAASIGSANTGSAINFSLPIGYAVLWAMAASALGYAMWYNRFCQTETRCIQAMAALTLFVGGTFVTIVTDDYTRRSTRIDLAVEELLEQLPAGAELVSLGEVHHNFEYQYHLRTGKFIRRIDPFPEDRASSNHDAKRSTRSEFAPEQVAGLTYVCTSLPVYLDSQFFPYPHEQICVVSCGRFAKKNPDMGVIVARLKTQTALAEEPAAESKSVIIPASGTY